MCVHGPGADAMARLMKPVSGRSEIHGCEASILATIESAVSVSARLSNRLKLYRGRSGISQALLPRSACYVVIHERVQGVRCVSSRRQEQQPPLSSEGQPGSLKVLDQLIMLFDDPLLLVNKGLRMGNGATRHSRLGTASIGRPEGFDAPLIRHSL